MAREPYVTTVTFLLLLIKGILLYKQAKVKQYCTEWARKTGYPLHIIKNAAHFSNGDNAEQVNAEIEKFISSMSILTNR